MCRDQFLESNFFMSKKAALKALIVPTTASLPPVYASATASPTMADVLVKVGEVSNAVSRFNDKIAAIEADLQDSNSRAAAARVLGSHGHITVDQKRDREDFVASLRGLVRAGLSTDSNPDGGFTVQPAVDQAIARVLENESTMRRHAHSLTISREAYVKIVNKGGTECAWVAEKESRPVTANSQLSKLEFFVNELMAQPITTQQLLDDSFMNVAGEIENDIAIAFALKENDAFFLGDGVKKPNGILSYTKQVSTPSAPSAWGKTGFTLSGDASGVAPTSATVSPADCLIDLQNSLRPGYRSNSVWIMNSSTAGVVRKFKDVEGRHIWVESLSQDSPSTLLGRPVAIDETMPNIEANAFPIALGDWKRAYVIVDHSAGIRMLRDNLTDKPWVKFYTTKRVGGGVQDFHAYKLLKIANA